MGAGKRRQIRKQICNMLYDFTKTDIPSYPEGWQDIAAKIMKLFPKPEITTYHIRETPHFRIKYYVCGKCKGMMEESPMACGMRFCPYCARRIMTMEDDTLCQ